MANNPNNVNQFNSPSVGQSDDEVSDKSLTDEYRQELENKKMEIRRKNNERIQNMLDGMSDLFDDNHETSVENKDEIDNSINSIKKELDFDVNST